jgi:hypothetical protein
MADSLRVGQAAPDFTATAVVDQEFKTIKLSDYRGKYVVLPSSVRRKSPHLAIDMPNSAPSTPKS